MVNLHGREMQHLSHSSTWRAPLLALGVVCLLASAGFAQKKTTRKPKVKLPIITITADREPLAGAERRLARFIILLQTGKRAQCNKMFSKTMPLKARRDFMGNRWLTKPAKGRLMSILFDKDLKLYTSNIRGNNALAVAVTPRQPGTKPGRIAVGILRVKMILENGKWQVFLPYGKI